eukprot:15453574-Alexandrium_andersonii.AAC.1
MAKRTKPKPNTVQIKRRSICHRRARVQIVRQLVHVGAPWALIRFMWYALHAASDLKQDVDFFETFAGARAITSTYKEANQNAIPFEIKDDPAVFNFIGGLGFLLVCLISSKLKGGGGFVSAPVCSSWVWVNRSTSKRSTHNPLGDTSKPSVRQANEMITNLTLCLWILESKGIWWVRSLKARTTRFEVLVGGWLWVRAVVGRFAISNALANALAICDCDSGRACDLIRFVATLMRTRGGGTAGLLTHGTPSTLGRADAQGASLLHTHMDERLRLAQPEAQHPLLQHAVDRPVARLRHP